MQSFRGSKWTVRGLLSDPAVLLCAGVAFVSILLEGCSAGSATSGQKAGAVPVTVAKAVRRSVPVDLQVIGNVEAYSTIAVKAQVGGQLIQVHFQEGDYVKKGDLLFTIDPRPFEAQVKQSEANLARDMALLKQAEANLLRDTAQERYARAQADRYQELQRQGVVSKELAEQYRTDADAKHDALEADRAAIESAKAAINADRANLENANVQLSYTTIHSPIDGRTGNLLVKQGNVVKANDIDLVTINQLEPIYATFAVPEARLSEIKRRNAERRLAVLVTPQKSGEADSETGVLTFLDNTVDQTTGTIKLKGTLPNRNHKLWPGEFVRVSLRLVTLSDAIVVPAQALQTGQDGQFIFVVKSNMSVESRPVEVGIRLGQDQVIQKGIEPGETVVTEGQLRLVPGSPVQIRNPQPGTS